MEINSQNTVRLLTIPAIARTGLLPVSTLRAMAHANQLPSIRVGKRTYVNYDQLLAMLGNLQGGDDNG